MEKNIELQKYLVEEINKWKEEAIKNKDVNPIMEAFALGYKSMAEDILFKFT